MSVAENIKTAPYAEPVYGNAPESLQHLDQWVLWRAEWDAKREKWNKKPIRAIGNGFAKSNDPKTWTDFATARPACEESYPERCSGIGFVFASDDPYVGIDLDDARDPETGEPIEWAVPILQRFAGTYAEISPSATGYKIWARGEKRWKGNSKPYGGGAVECYDRSRYFTLTGWRHGEAVEIADCQDALDWLGEAVFAPPKPKPKQSAGDDDEWGVIRNGHANNEIMRRLGKLQSQGLPDSVIRDYAYGMRFENPPPPEEIEKRLQAVLAYPKGEPQPEQRSREEQLEFLREYMGANRPGFPTLAGFRRIGEQNPNYEMVLTDGRKIELGTMTHMRQMSNVADAMMEQAQLPGPKAQKKWREVRLAIRDIADQVDAGDGDVVGGWLEAFEASCSYRPFGDNDISDTGKYNEALKTIYFSRWPHDRGRCFRDAKGDLLFKLEGLLGFVTGELNEKITGGELRAKLAQRGVVPPPKNPSKINNDRGGRVKAYIWRWPEGGEETTLQPPSHPHGYLEFGGSAKSSSM